MFNQSRREEVSERTKINVLLLRHFLNYLSLSMHLFNTSDEVHAWFHLNAARQVSRNTQQAKII